jgi:hypothetical protein
MMFVHRPTGEMTMTTSIRELTAADIDLVSGGLQDGYVYCTGNRAPAGDGVYAGDSCPVTVGALIEAFHEGIRQGSGKGGKGGKA